MARSSRFATRFLVTFGVCVACCSVAGAVETGRITQRIETPQFEILTGADGQRIRLEGFGVIGESGKPLLPGKIFAVAVPPGATVTSVGYVAEEPVVIQGSFVVPVTPMARVIGEEDSSIFERRRTEWQAVADAAANSDDPYPERPVTLVGTGGYRGYRLVDIRVAPFRYRSASGTLEYYESLTVTVDFEYSEGNLESAYDLIPDLEKTAREIILNFDQARTWLVDRTREGEQTTDGFLIITKEALVDAVAPLVAHETNKGRTVHVATVEWIDAQYLGIDRAARMRRFLRVVYPSSEWGIRDLLLVGDPADVPMRETCDDLGYGPPLTDFYFAELSSDDADSWDSNGDQCFGEDGVDQVDLYSEINVGRIPWSDPAIVVDICEKSVAYEVNQDPSFKKNILVMGSFFWETTDTAVLMEAKLAQPWMADWTVTRMYEDNAEIQSSYDCDQPLNYTNAVAAMSTGRYAFVNWAGHGSPTSAHIMGGGGAAFVNTAACTSLDDAFPSIIWSDSCSTANPAYNHLGREMLRQGAVGYVGSTEVALGSWEWQGPEDGSSQSCDYWFTSKVTSGEMTQGEAHQWALRKLYTDGLWDYPRYEMFEWTLHGNPNLGMGEVRLDSLFEDGFESGDITAWSGAVGD